jgi:hypothetical protein
MNEQRTQLWVALVALAVGGFLLHYRLHPPSEGLTDFWASFFCAIDVIVVSALFLSKTTAVWALLLNSFLAFVGIIMMTDLTIVWTYNGGIKASPLHEPTAWLLHSMLPDIAILVADFMTGLVLYKVTIGGPSQMAVPRLDHFQ